MSYRSGLGKIELHAGSRCIPWITWLKYTGAFSRASFPSIAAGEPAQFDALLHDLEHYCAPFLRGELAEFDSVFAEIQSNPEAHSGFGALPD
jgi:hypothetical protein